MSVVRIATRGSDLALVQAEYVGSRIREVLDVETKLVIVQTTGDRVQNQSLAKIGGKGLFVKEIQEALLEDRADVAVHSAKDLPAEITPGLELVAFPQREDPRDALVSRAPGASVLELRSGARVGTGSTRRRALLLAARPDFEIVPLRGNVPTRIGKLDSESLDAVVLACAGLDRLGLGKEISERISTDVLLPAVCQGTLALEARAGGALTSQLARLDNGEVGITAKAERAFLSRIGGDCTTPLAVFAELQGSERDAMSVRVRGLLCSLDGTQVVRHEASGDASEAAALGTRVAEAVLEDGGSEILRELGSAP